MALVLPFLDFCVLPRKTLHLTKDFCPLPNPLKLWKNQRKHTNNLSVSRWAPFVAHILRVVSLVRNPAELDRVGEFTEVEGQTWSSAW